jgi:hypothetical protein
MNGHLVDFTVQRGRPFKDFIKFFKNLKKDGASCRLERRLAASF